MESRHCICVSVMCALKTKERESEEWGFFCFFERERNLDLMPFGLDSLQKKESLGVGE